MNLKNVLHYGLSYKKTNPSIKQVGCYGEASSIICLPPDLKLFINSHQDSRVVESVSFSSRNNRKLHHPSSMSSPAEFYNSLPPISKAYGTLCLAATTLATLKLLPVYYIALIYEEVFYHLQVWRLLTNFIFLGPFSINFGIRLLMILRYGVQLENGPFNRRTADFLWMIIFGASTLLVLAAIPFFETFFMGVSLVFMLLYVWSREFPNANINIYGLVQLKAFYLPWAMLAMDVIFGSPIGPDLCGILAGHLYYFLTVLHPLAGGKNILQTPMWLRKIVAKYRIGAPASTQTQTTNNTSGVFSGRSYRVGG